MPPVRSLAGGTDLSKVIDLNDGDDFVLSKSLFRNTLHITPLCVMLCEQSCKVLKNSGLLLRVRARKRLTHMCI